MHEIRGIEGLRAALDDEVGVSDWHVIEQDQIDSFAWCTGDHYWIHTDPTRAAKSDPGGTIAHGLLVLSLGPTLTYSMLEVSGFSSSLNYGFERIRFTAPVPVGSRVRLRMTLSEICETEAGVRATFHQTFEIEGATKPACVADAIIYWEKLSRGA